MSAQVVSPIDGSVFCQIQYQTKEYSLTAIEQAHQAYLSWKQVPLPVKIEFINKFIDAFVADKDNIAKELSHVLGRPFKQNYNEVRGFEERARYLVSVAESSLKTTDLPPKEGFQRYITREPLGVVLVIAPWNYPYLCMVNSVIPALLAGNTVIVKQAPQTFVCADRFTQAFKAAGLPQGVFQHLHIDHTTAEAVIQHPLVSFVQFTGSVRGGHQVNQVVAAPKKFIGTGFELGGKDPAYVRQDADIAYAAENVLDGAFYNSGQSCCAVERVYVHESVYDAFIAKCLDVIKGYKLGNPLEEGVNLGPVVNMAAANTIREHVQEAISKGAKALVDESQFPAAKPGSAYVAPQILVHVDHSMKIMTQETFGPVVGIMKVTSDEEAVKWMNDSEFGLTASVWTEDQAAAERIGRQIETGTVFMNRCDYLDPALPWVGVKQSGHGVSLSPLGFHALTRPKSFHLRIKH